MLLSDVPVLAAHHAPETPAVIFQDESISYDQVRDRCWRLSNALIAVTKPGDRVVILAENCPEYVDFYYGVPGASQGLWACDVETEVEACRWPSRSCTITVSARRPARSARAVYCIEESVKYARAREPFGEELSRNQAIQWPLVELAT